MKFDQHIFPQIWERLSDWRYWT